MTLPIRPPISDPIPNPPVPNYPRQYSVKGPYWDMLIGENLEVGENGELTYPDGAGDGNNSVILQGAWWPMGIGEGLDVENGELITIVD